MTMPSRREFLQSTAVLSLLPLSQIPDALNDVRPDTITVPKEKMRRCFRRLEYYRKFLYKPSEAWMSCCMAIDFQKGQFLLTGGKQEYKIYHVNSLQGSKELHGDYLGKMNRYGLSQGPLKIIYIDRFSGSGDHELLKLKSITDWDHKKIPDVVASIVRMRDLKQGDAIASIFPGTLEGYLEWKCQRRLSRVFEDPYRGREFYDPDFQDKPGFDRWVMAEIDAGYQLPERYHISLI